MFRRNEIYIRRLPYEQAELILKKELDRYYLQQENRVRIIHGKGEGILKKMVWDYLSGQPFIKQFYEAPFFEGGAGVTIAEFKF